MSLERYRVGDLVVDGGTGTPTRGGQRLQLPPLSFNLLVVLLRRAPEIARRSCSPERGFFSASSAGVGAALTVGLIQVTLRRSVHAAGGAERQCGGNLRGPLLGP